MSGGTILQSSILGSFSTGIETLSSMVRESVSTVWKSATPSASHGTQEPPSYSSSLSFKTAAPSYSLLSHDRSGETGGKEASSRGRRQLRALQTAQQASASSALSKGDSSDDDDGSASMSMSEENSNDISSIDTVSSSSARAWWQLRVAQDAAAARRRKTTSARHLRDVIAAEEKERSRRMELVAEASRFSAREALKARQLACSIEDQEQYTRVREWIVNDTQSQETRAKNRRLAIAALNQEAHRQLVARLHLRQIEAGKAADTDGAVRRNALVHEGRVRARLLLHAGLRIEAARIVMEMEEDIAEEMLQAEVRALSDKPIPGVAVNLDDELIRLLKGPGYSLARRSLGIESSSLPDSARCSAPSGDSGTRFLHSSGFNDDPASPRLSRISQAILSLHASLLRASNGNAAAESSSSDTASLPLCQSSWSASSVSEAEVAVRDWIVDDKVADNVFRLRETLSGRMHMRTQTRGDSMPVLGGDVELQSGFALFTDLGNPTYAGPCQRAIQASNNERNVSISKSDLKKTENSVSEIADSIGDVFKGAFDSISSGVGAVAQGASMLSFPSLPTFPFPNFAGNSANGATTSDCANISDAIVAPVVPCGFDRKHIEELLLRSNAYTSAQETHPVTTDSSSGLIIDSSGTASAAIAKSHQRSSQLAIGTPGAAGLASPVSLRESPVPPLSPCPVAMRASPTPRVLVSAAAASSSSSPSTLSLEQLASQPVENLQAQRFLMITRPASASNSNVPLTAASSSSFSPSRAGALASPGT